MPVLALPALPEIQGPPVAQRSSWGPATSGWRLPAVPQPSAPCRSPHRHPEQHLDRGLAAAPSAAGRQAALARAGWGSMAAAPCPAARTVLRGPIFGILSNRKNTLAKNVARSLGLLHSTNGSSPGVIQQCTTLSRSKFMHFEKTAGLYNYLAQTLLYVFREHRKWFLVNISCSKQGLLQQCLTHPAHCATRDIQRIAD